MREPSDSPRYGDAMGNAIDDTLRIDEGGSITRGDRSPLVRWTRTVPVAGELLDWGPIRHAGSARQLGGLVRESPRFVLSDLLRLTGVRRYHLRRSGRPVLLRHGTVDVWTFAEIFSMGFYEAPLVVAERLKQAQEPLVLDLGANIGMFGLDVLSWCPDARIVGYEPDAESAAIHRRLLELNARGDAWQLVEACAGPVDGTVTFLPGQETGSRVVGDSEPGTIELPMVDVMPLIAEADLVKLDIEGAEWPLLADPRLGAARAIVLEYHPNGCPSDDPAGTAQELLRSHGFEITPLFHHPGGVGMMWATRA